MEAQIQELLQWIRPFLLDAPWWKAYPLIWLALLIGGPVAGGFFGVLIAQGEISFLLVFLLYVTSMNFRDMTYYKIMSVALKDNPDSFLRRHSLTQSWLDWGEKILNKPRVDELIDGGHYYYNLFWASVIPAPFDPQTAVMLASGVMMKKPAGKVYLTLVVAQVVSSALTLLAGMQLIENFWVGVFIWGSFLGYVSWRGYRHFIKETKYSL